MKIDIEKCCAYCENMSCEKDRQPCVNCERNPRYIDHFKVHQAIVNFMERNNHEKNN